MKARRQALAVLDALFENGRSLSATLDDESLASLAPSDRSLCRALVYGVVRHYRLLEALVDRYLDRPLRPRDRHLRRVLAMGFYQLGWMRIPAHAAVSETVSLVEARWARGLVNALLRRYQREAAPTTLDQAPPAVSRSHPDWLADLLAADWGDARDAILEANNQEPPMWLRIDPRKIDRDRYRSLLAEEGMEAVTGAAPDALRLARPVAVEALPGFAAGWTFVQDAAAQYAARLLSPQRGERILDACAAPGGKAAHLLSLASDLRLTCVETDGQRARLIDDNLRRSGDQATVVTGDAGAPDAWWDGNAFDAILLDAPCSGTGVIRRHPDIKWLRREADIPALAGVQDRLLAACWSLLRPGGRLLYCTCSVLREENERRLAAFLDSAADAVVESPKLPAGRAVGPGWQILPGEDDHDGFFYSLLTRQ